MDIKRIIREELDDFDWISTASDKPNPYVGMKFTYPRHSKTKVFTIDSIVGDTIIISDNKSNYIQDVPLRHVVLNLDNEIFLRESNDFQWIEDTPEFNVGDK